MRCPVCDEVLEAEDWDVEQPECPHCGAALQTLEDEESILGTHLKPQTEDDSEL